MSPLALFFFFRSILAIFSPLNFHMSFGISLSIKEASWDVVGTHGQNLKMDLQSAAILAILSLLVHGHGMSLHLFLS